MDTPTATTASTTMARQPTSWASRVAKAALVASLASLPLTLLAPSHAAMDPNSGVRVLNTANQCNEAPTGFDEYTMVMTGGLEGCLYTNILTDTTTLSGDYLETGLEIFVGSMNGGPEGIFTNAYRFEAKYAPDGTVIHGRYQHPIVDGSGIPVRGRFLRTPMINLGNVWTTVGIHP